MATLLDARRGGANFKEITATLQHLVNTNVKLLSHDSNVSHAPDGVDGARTTMDLARKLEYLAAFPHTYDEFFLRVTLCEILLEKLLDDHLTTYVAHRCIRALDEQQQDDDTESIPEELL